MVRHRLDISNFGFGLFCSSESFSPSNSCQISGDVFPSNHYYEQSANLALGQGDYRERLADKPDPTQTGFNDAAVRSIIRAYKDMDIAVEHQDVNQLFSYSAPEFTSVYPDGKNKNLQQLIYSN
jgi:hypothetical protein